MIDISKELLNKYNNGSIGLYSEGDRVEIVKVRDVLKPWIDLKEVIGLQGTVVEINSCDKEQMYKEAKRGFALTCSVQALETCMEANMFQRITVKMDKPIQYTLVSVKAKESIQQINNCFFVFKKI